VPVRIAFFGLPLGALLLQRDGHTIVHAAICRPGAIGTRRLVRALGEDKVDVKPNVETAVFARKLKKAKPDIVVSWFWTTRLPMSVVSLAPLGGFGVHPSLLPRHRGPDPYFWAIDAGDTVTGVTAHRIAEGYDTGAILGQRMLRIDPEWSAWTLAKQLDRPSLALLREIAGAFARGAPPPDIAQDDTKATLAPAPDDALLEIDWTQSSARIERRVLAASPYPGAYTFLGDEEVTVTRVEPADAFPKALAPGEAAIVGSGPSARAIVRTGDGALELLAGRGGEEGDYDLDRHAFCELIDALKSA
jgi:methionyl-tRNA formyltransferase